MISIVRNIFLIWLVAVLGLFSCQPAPIAPIIEPMTSREICYKYSRNIVEVATDEERGTGVILENDDDTLIIATCYHVAGYDATRIKLRFDGENDYVSSGITVTGYSRKYDLTVLKVAKKMDVYPLSYGVEDMGSAVTCLGNADGNGVSATSGIVSQIDDVKLVNGAINPYVRLNCTTTGGMSGGGVFDEYGQLIALIGARDLSYENIGYAMSIEIINALTAKALAGPSVDEIDCHAITFSEPIERAVTVTVDGSAYTYKLNERALYSGETRIAKVNGEWLNDYSLSAFTAQLLSFDSETAIIFT